MTNEIKEILFLLHNDRLTESGKRKLEDYITNLQEENERLKLNQTKKVFDTIAGLIKNSETCSYRYLIYDLLGFQEKDYVDLMGGLSITNMLVDYEDYKQRIDKATDYLLDKYVRGLLGDNEVNNVVKILRGDE